MNRNLPVQMNNLINHLHLQMAKELVNRDIEFYEIVPSDYVARFKCPILTKIKLLDNYLYAKIQRAGPQFPKDEDSKLHNYGKDIVTGKFATDPNYCRINFCDKGFIKEIVVMTNKVCLIFILFSYRKI